MGVEKQGSKSGGGYVGSFFQLFDWNGKSRKKLFPNKFDLPEGSKQGKRSDENLPMTRVRLIHDDENGGVSSANAISEYSCASSVTDDEGNGIKAPGVVARLMGLDSLPTSSVSEPYATPFFESGSVRDINYPRKAPEFLNEYQNLSSSNHSGKVDSFCRKTIEPRPQKLENNRHIERFRTETLPPKSAKSHPITPHHKLLSPIKNPGYISAKNATHLMEAAAKILEPGLQSSSKGNFPSLGSSSVPIKVPDLKENTAASKRPLRLPEVSRRPIESNAVKYLKGQSLDKSWNGSGDTSNIRACPDLEENHSVGSKSKGKSISLAIQAKVNVQRREGLSSSIKGLLTRKEEDAYKPNQPLKNPSNTLKNKQTKSSIASATGVLRQNNQKQNCLANKDKLPSKPSLSNQQGRKVLSGNSSFGRNKTFNKVSGNSKVGPKKEALQTMDLEKEVPSSRTKNFPRKKRAIDGDFYSEKSVLINSASVDREKGMDVVSFTFTSPMIKPISGSQSSGHMVEKRENFCYVDSHNERSATDAKPRRMSSLGMNVIGGDALSYLLEQKLKELTSGVESPCSSSVKAGTINSSAYVLHDLVAALNSVSAMPREFDKTPQPGPQTEKLVFGSDSGFSSTNAETLKMNLKLQGVGGIADCSSSCDARKQLECQHPSPVSILEPSSSSESCNSSESWDNGSKLCPSVEAQNFVGLNCPKKISSVEAEMELSDSASSAFTRTLNREQVGLVGLQGSHISTDKQEMEYVREILAQVMLKGFPLGHAHEIIDPLIFDRLENKKIVLRNEAEDKESRIGRKVLFDCVNECLDLKCSLYFRRGYRTWAKGVAVVKNEGLAKEVYKEILGWRSMEDWMVDDLVDKDMSSQLGRWTDFEAEVFEIGVEIERGIFSSLFDEIVADLFM
ncbi:serine-rich adhesin for platelets-like protein [Tasmannia lanceolata]|uniref:serine-rich adhesin for platelets-like protein n=1 Tax=Tasmannia lanceolata TaxID=3420 RepID=UPI0040636696